MVGWTPLHFAVRAQNPLAAGVLVSVGALVEVGDQRGGTALWRAVFGFRGEGERLRVLLGAGVDPDRENAHGVSPRGLAGRVANGDVAAHLLRGEGSLR